jgi:septum site-determining protein MinD
VLDLLKVDLIGIVPEDETIITSTNLGEPVTSLGRSKAGEAYNRIAARLLGERVPLPNLDGDNALLELWSRFFKR